MKERFENWNPKPESLDRLKQITEVLTKYDEMDIRLTLRQLYYQLVSQNIIPNKTREYKNLGALLGKARMAGLVDWSSIEDRARTPKKAADWSSIKSIAEIAAEQFRLPRWDDQPKYVELWCEKDALSSVLEPITRDLHVTLMINRGYSSLSAMYDSSKRFLEASERGQELTLLYLGDLDPSGEDMVRDIRNRLNILGVDELEVRKIAVNAEQVEEYKLEPNPAKLTDSRSEGFIAEHGESSYEVDAIPPESLMEIVRQEIEDRMDLDAYEAVKDRENDQRKQLSKLLPKIETES